MKTTPSSLPAFSSPPRLVCRAVRQWCALRDAAGSRHAATCADCQAYFASVRNIDAELRREARSPDAALSPSGALADRIIRAVRVETTPRPRERSFFGGGLWLGLGGVAAAAAVAALLALRVPDGGQPVAPTMAIHGTEAPTPATGSSAAVAASDLRMVVDAVDSLSTTLSDSVIPRAGELMANNPLQHELDSVYADARSALDFLALNFLPRSASATPPPAAVRPRTG